MSDLFTALQWLLAAPVTAMLAYFALEILFGLRPLSRRDVQAEPGSLAIIVPAHDEAAGIAATVGALREAAPNARLLVVADNCSDATASLAAGAGADVVQRHDPERRGKGYALDFGRRFLADDPPEVVLVIDADCRIEPGGAEALARHVRASGGPVQAANLLAGGQDMGAQVAISNFAMMVKNLFRARGMMRLGGGGLLFGTGMAFPWSLFAQLPLATGDATEDIALGLQLARKGQFVRLADEVRVVSPPASLSASRGQRSRWEHGFLRNMGRQALPMLWRGLAGGSRAQLAIGLHMLVPPLALLVLLGSAALALATVLALPGGSWVPVGLLTGAFGLALLALLAAWWSGGRVLLPARSLLAIPLYVLWKVPIYLAFFRKRQDDWNRTGRDGDPADNAPGS